ncbi:unnamed protein product, partial [Allacma fusca]
MRREVLLSLWLPFFLTEALAGTLKFVLEPEDTIVPKGGNVFLNCAARGDGQAKISWKKDRTLLTFDSDGHR